MIMKAEKDGGQGAENKGTFEALKVKPEFIMAVEMLGIDRPNNVQRSMLSKLLATPRPNMVLRNRSGTGKTLGFCLVMLNHVDTEQDFPQVLCISPTYELTMQTASVVARLCAFRPDVRIKHAVAPEDDRSPITEHVIIGTADIVVQWAAQGRRLDLSKLWCCVLDEGDTMIKKQGGHCRDVMYIFQKLDLDCQVIVVSATYEKEVWEFSQLVVFEPVLLQLERHEDCLDQIKQYYVRCESEVEKYLAIRRVYSLLECQILVYCHTRAHADWLAHEMRSDGHNTTVLYKELSGTQRVGIVTCFQEGLIQLLISYDGSSSLSGIDLPSVALVVHFDLPLTDKDTTDYDTYLHRISRPGKHWNRAVAINLLETEAEMAQCFELSQHFGKNIAPFDTNSVDAILNLQPTYIY